MYSIILKQTVGVCSSEDHYHRRNKDIDRHLETIISWRIENVEMGVCRPIRCDADIVTQTDANFNLNQFCIFFVIVAHTTSLSYFIYDSSYR